MIPDADNTLARGVEPAVKYSRKSGSSQRQKQTVRTFRLSPNEEAELVANAEREGLSVGSFIRSRVLIVAQTRRRHRPAVEVAELARLQAAINRVGGNIHQILKRVNFGETPLAYEFQEALTGYRDAVDAILAVLGRKEAP